MQASYFLCVLSAIDFALSSAVVWNSLPTALRVSSLTAATFDRHVLSVLTPIRTVCFARYKMCPLLSGRIAVLRRYGLLLQTD